MNDHTCSICKTSYDAYMEKYECEIKCKEAVKFNKPIITKLKALPRYDLTNYGRMSDMSFSNTGAYVAYSDLEKILKQLQ